MCWVSWSTQQPCPNMRSSVLAVWHLSCRDIGRDSNASGAGLFCSCGRLWTDAGLLETPVYNAKSLIEFHMVCCRMRFTGPPRSTLSGAALEAGVDTDTLASVSEQNFFGELTAQAELVHL